MNVTEIGFSADFPQTRILGSSSVKNAGDANRIQEAGVLDIIGRLASPGIWDDQICMLFLIDIRTSCATIL